MSSRRSARTAAASASQDAAQSQSTSQTQQAQPLEDLAIVLSGKFNDIGHNQTSFEKLIKSLGGKVQKSVAATTTHLVCTGDDYESNTAKVAQAKDRQLPMVNPSWVLDCEKEGKLLDIASYTWGTKSAPKKGKQPTTRGTKRSADTSGDTSVGKKRPTVVVNGDTDAEPDIKKAQGAGGAKATKATKNGKAKAGDSVGVTDGDTTAAKKVKAKADADADSDKSVKKEKDVAEGQFTKKDLKIPVDEHCPFSNYRVWIDSDGMIWDASLNQSNSQHNNNKFYRLQIVYDPDRKDYKTWTRWGRVGETGQSASLGSGSLQDATKQFESKFRSKTGLPWDKRGDNPKPGKYAFVERNYNDDSDDDEEEEETKGTKKEPDEEYKPVECTLDKPVKDLMELIFNQHHFQAAMSALNYDANKLPLGKLSKATITRGFQQLKDLAALMDDPALAASKWNTSYSDAIANLSNTYYSVIPHAFGRNRPPVIGDDTMLKKEIELLESLSDMKEASDIMKIDRKSTVHPLDRQYLGLGMQEMVALEHTSNEFSMLSNYLNDSRGATHHMNYQVQEIFRIERSGEHDRFDKSPFAKIPSDRRLLWHGSRVTNFGGILSQGLRIAPPEAPVSGYMFGKGIYLADMSSKSAGYCNAYHSGGDALLLLCEAELGDPIQKLTGASYNAGETAKKNGMHSTWGQGNTGPTKWMDAGAVHDSLAGVKIPDLSQPPGPTNVKGAGLFYNEYICYDVAQVKLRYLLRVKL